MFLYWKDRPDAEERYSGGGVKKQIWLQIKGWSKIPFKTVLSQKEWAWHARGPVYQCICVYSISVNALFIWVLSNNRQLLNAANFPLTIKNPRPDKTLFFYLRPPCDCPSKHDQSSSCLVFFWHSLAWLFLCPCGMRSRCPDHPGGLLLMWWSSDSNSELLLSDKAALRESPGGSHGPSFSH